MSGTPIWRTRRTRRREASRGTERLPRIGVKRPPVALPVALARGHGRDAAEHADHGPLHVALAGGARPRRFIPGPVHPVGGTPDADPEAGLRRIDPAALRAPPGRDVFGGLVGVTGGSWRLSTASAARCDARYAACQPSGPGSVPASVSTTGRHAPTRARTADRPTSSASNSAALTSSSRCSEQAVSHVPQRFIAPQPMHVGTVTRSGGRIALTASSGARCTRPHGR